MGSSKTEINLRRLLAAAPQQQNQAKLIHYVATLRELLEQLSEEITPEGLPRVSKAMVNDYSEKIESIASRLASPVDLYVDASTKESRQAIEGEKVISPPGLRKRSVFLSSGEDRGRDNIGADSSPLVKLDAAAHSHIDKHRKLQEDLTDEMVGLAQKLKQSSLLMSQSLKNTEKLVSIPVCRNNFHCLLEHKPTWLFAFHTPSKAKAHLLILDSTEKAVERSLASTGHANVRAGQVFSEGSKTSCFTWLLMFVMTCVFMMVVLLIRVT